VTGLPLIWLYQPDPRGGGRGDFWWLRGAHSTMSMVFVGAAAGTVAVLAVAAARRLGVRVPPGWFVALAVLVVALVGLLSGQLIAWDSLTFGPVGVSDPRGVAGALSGDVRLIFVDGSEVSRRAYAAWAGVHVLAVPLLALGVAWIVRRRA
jgi:hypothetical protein